MTKGTILLVDDEEKLRSLLKRIVALEGYRVMQVHQYYLEPRVYIY